MSPALSETVQTAARPRASVSQAWMRALELTAPIPRQRERVLPAVVDELGYRLGDKPALLSDRECFTYHELAGAHGSTPAGRSLRAWPRATWSAC